MKTALLGAGASRSVSYHGTAGLTPSPLDSDYFQLLQRLEPSASDADAAEAVLESWLQAASDPLCGESMEKVFYTLHLRRVIREKFFAGTPGSSDKFVANFARTSAALLRSAHGTHTCAYHRKVLSPLRGDDAIITFNYDLVVERALKKIHQGHIDFDPWIYGFKARPVGVDAVPTYYKLHGSMNWVSGPGGDTDGFEVRQQSWNDFDKKPGYRAPGPDFPILLPYWDKKIEEAPWDRIWSRAANHLRNTKHVVIWGYSLPMTDIKAHELVKQGLCGKYSKLECVCVIDPSKETVFRWRQMLMRKKFWHFEDVAGFLERTPEWWK